MMWEFALGGIVVLVSVFIGWVMGSAGKKID